MAIFLSSYFDESAVDGGVHSSAVGGLVLNHSGHFWLGEEWARTIDRHRPGKPIIHMKEFGVDGDLKDLPAQRKRPMFRDLVRVINDNKAVTVGSTLTPQEYREHFGFLEKSKNLSIHAMCFLQAAIVQGKWAEAAGYPYTISFLLDAGCPDRKDIDRAHHFLTQIFDYAAESHAGELTWGDDALYSQLQAADLVSWAVRRKASGLPFKDGCEPLLDLFEERHFGEHLRGEWLAEAAAKIRAKLA